MSPAREDILRSASRHPMACAAEVGLRDAGVGTDEPIVLGVSGGADSMAMLVLVAAVRLRSDPALDSISVLACDHGLRPEAAGECESVIALCERIGVRSRAVERIQVDAGGNRLAAARDARLAALWRHASRVGSRSLLLAHHADDVAEGLLLAMARGGGLDSVRSLVPRREHDGLGAVCRPLLGVRRLELQRFLESLGISWHEDPSNRDHSRGALRTDAVASLLVGELASGIGGFVEEANELLVLRDLLADDLAPLGSVRVSRDAFDRAAAAVRAAAIVRLARASGGSLARVSIERAVRDSGSPDRRPRKYAGRGGSLQIDAREVRWIRTTAD